LAIASLRGTLTGNECLLEFVSRLKEALYPTALTKRELFHLAGANAFESLGLSRRQALWEIQALPLQDSHPLPHPEEPTRLPKESPWEKISFDYESMGVSLYAHPMELFRKGLDQKGFIHSSALKQLPIKHFRSQKKVKVSGIVISRQMPPAASGVLFISLEDEYGFINLVIWKDTYEKYREILLAHSFLLCEGRIEKPKDGNVIHVIVEHVFPLLAPGPPAKEIRSHDFH